jgi:hypothetical protein
MWALWCRTRGAMGTLGHLPAAGGLLDQHAPTMQALDVITETMAWLDERFPHRAKAKGSQAG